MTKFLNLYSAAVIHFWAVWNGADPPMDQNIQMIQAQFQHQIQFASCDTDALENRELCQRLRIASLPSLVVFVKHRRVRLIAGLREPNELADELERCLDPSYAFKKWWQFWNPSESISRDVNLPTNWLKKPA